MRSTLTNEIKLLMLHNKLLFISYLTTDRFLSVLHRKFNLRCAMCMAERPFSLHYVICNFLCQNSLICDLGVQDDSKM